MTNRNMINNISRPQENNKYYELKDGFLMIPLKDILNMSVYEEPVSTRSYPKIQVSITMLKQY